LEKIEKIEEIEEIEEIVNKSNFTNLFNQIYWFIIAFYRRIYNTFRIYTKNETRMTIFGL